MIVPLDALISAIFSLVLIVVFFAIGIKIMMKYRISKTRSLIFMGLAWIGLSLLWWSSFLTVFVVLVNISSNGLTPELYIFFTLFFIPFTGFFYITAITDLTIEKAQRYLQLFVIIFGGFCGILCVYLIFSGNTAILITKIDPYMVRYEDMTIILLSINLAFFLLLGMFFAIQTFRSDNPEIRLKGKILIIAYGIFTVGGIMDMLPFPLLNYVERLVVTISAIVFYWGFTLPEWIKKLFLKPSKE